MAGLSGVFDVQTAAFIGCTRGSLAEFPFPPLPDLAPSIVRAAPLQTVDAARLRGVREMLEY